MTVKERVAIQSLKSMKEAMGFGRYKDGHWEALYEKEKQPYLKMADQILSLLIEEIKKCGLPDSPYQPDGDKDELWCDIGARDKDIYLKGARASRQKIIKRLEE